MITIWFTDGTWNAFGGVLEADAPRVARDYAASRGLVVREDRWQEVPV